MWVMRFTSPPCAVTCKRQLLNPHSSAVTYSVAMIARPVGKKDFDVRGKCGWAQNVKGPNTLYHSRTVREGKFVHHSNYCVGRS